LDLTEDVEQDSEEELDMQVVFGLCSVEVSDLYCQQELDEVEIVVGPSENEIHDSEDELSDQELHHEEEIAIQIACEVFGVEVVYGQRGDVFNSLNK
jgi:hypothetical protein